MRDRHDRMLGAIEAGGTKIVCALASRDGAIAALATLPTTTPGETLARIADFFASATAEQGAPAAFGIASFGPIDIDTRSPGYGTILVTTKPGWQGACYRDALQGFDVPIGIDSDVNGAALGEWQAGAGQGCATLAYVTVGTGIGAGVVRHGAPLSGIGHYELGHIRPPRDPARDPFPGRCPFHGDCLEGLASGPAILDRWGKTLGELPPDHAGHGLVAGYLGHLALTLILAHMPDRIVFGGGVMKTPGLIEAVRAETRALLGGYSATPQLAGDLENYIAVPGLGDRSGITGAIELARRATANAT